MFIPLDFLCRRNSLTGSSLSFSFTWQAMAVPLTLSIRSLKNDPFDVDVLNTNTVSDLRQRLFERLGLDPAKWHLKLTYGLTVLEDPTATLSAYNLETGCCLTMVKESPGPNFLHATINDYQNATDSSHLRPAARSKELVGPVNSIEVSAKTFRDQEHGYAKSKVFLTLMCGAEVRVRQNIWGTDRGRDYKHGQHPPAISYTDRDDIVSQAKSGCFYQMEYEVGHGVGHTIIVEDWAVKISYLSSSCTEPSDVVNFRRDYHDE